MIQISDESPPPGSNEADTEQLDAVELNDLASEVKTKNGIVWRTSRQAWLLCHWARQLTERLRRYVADRWPTHTSPCCNCEVAHPACRKSDSGYPPMAVRLVNGGATSHS